MKKIEINYPTTVEAFNSVEPAATTTTPNNNKENFTPNEKIFRKIWQTVKCPGSNATEWKQMLDSRCDSRLGGIHTMALAHWCRLLRFNWDARTVRESWNCLRDDTLNTKPIIVGHLTGHTKTFQQSCEKFHQFRFRVEWGAATRSPRPTWTF